MTTVDIAIQQFNDQFVLKYQQVEKLAGTSQLVRNALGDAYKWPTLGTADMYDRGAYNTSIPTVDLTKTFVTTSFTEKTLRTSLGRDEKTLTNADERSQWVNRHAGAVGRFKDSLKITALDGASTNVVPVGTTNLTLDKVLEAQELLLAANIPDSPINIAIHANQLHALLAIDRFTSSDYFMKSLTTGRVQGFLGMNWIIFGTSTVGGLPKAGNNRSCFAWVQDALGVVSKEEIQAEVWWNQDTKSYIADSTVIEGASVLDENGIVKIVCDETK